MLNGMIDLVAETKAQDALRQAEHDRLTKTLSRRRWWAWGSRAAQSDGR